MVAEAVVVVFAGVVDSTRRVAEKHQVVLAKTRHLPASPRANLRAAGVVAATSQQGRPNEGAMEEGLGVEVLA